MKFSFLVPVYNGQTYIKKCIESLLNQSYKDYYEIIIVDDGSTDDTPNILKTMSKKHKNVKIYTQQNGGVSRARNLMVEKCKSDYFIFVDADDYVNPELLVTINKNMKKNIDIIKYQFTTVDTCGNKINEFIDENFEASGTEAFSRLVERKNFFDVVWLYAFNKGFWDKNKLKFKENIYHEDFELIPYAILKSKRMISINFNGYYYVQTENSIMRTNNIDKEIIKAKNLLECFDSLKSKVYKLKLDSMTLSIFNSYIANALLLKASVVPKKYLFNYIEELKNRGVGDLLIDNSFIRKIKKIAIKKNLGIYIKLQRIYKR